MVVHYMGWSLTHQKLLLLSFGHSHAKESRQWKGWGRANIQCKHFIPKDQTHSYFMGRQYLPGHGLVPHFLLGTHIITYNIVFAMQLLLMDLHKLLYKIESQT